MTCGSTLTRFLFCANLVFKELLFAFVESSLTQQRQKAMHGEHGRHQNKECVATVTAQFNAA